jgi:hypothetical protein
VYYCKTISTITSKPVKSTGWFVTAGIISVAALFGGCTSIVEHQATNPVVWSDPSTSWMADAGRHFIEPEIQSLLTEKCGNFWGKKIDNQQVLLTISPKTRIGRFENLISEYNVAISTANLPQDLEVYLKSYRHEEYGNYYNYLRTFVDTIILCPQYIYNNGIEAAGMSWPDNYDKLFYLEGGKLLFLSTFYYYNAPSSYTATRKLLTTISHEVAHKQLLHLIYTEKVPYSFWNYNINERYALLVETELLEKILRTPMSKKEEDYLRFRYNTCLQQIRNFNIIIGFPAESRELFPEY